MTKWDLSLGCKGDLTYVNQLIWFTTLTGIKDQNHIIIPMNTEKNVSYNSTHLYDKKSFNTLDIEDLYLNQIKDIYNKPTINVILTVEKLKLFF